MTNIEKMKSYLRKYVFPQLYEKGFEGKWPHFRRELGNCVELVSFYTNKWGGSFSVYVSAIFPNSENKNYAIHKWMDITEDRLSAGDANRDYRLKGMYDGEFHYRDLYRKLMIGLGMVYLHAPEKKESHSFHQKVTSLSENSMMKRHLRSAKRSIDNLKKLSNGSANLRKNIKRNMKNRKAVQNYDH